MLVLTRQLCRNPRPSDAAATISDPNTGINSPASKKLLKAPRAFGTIDADIISITSAQTGAKNGLMSAFYEARITLASVGIMNKT